MTTTRITDIRSTFWRFLKLFIQSLFFLVVTGNAVSSTDPGRMTPSSLDENSEVKDTKKRKKRAHNNDDDQASYQEKFLALQKKQLEDQVAQEERQMQFFQKFLDEQRKLESEEREKDRKFFLQLSTILKGK